MHEGDSLRDAWDREATAWIAWARSPEHDHAFWHLNLPVLLALTPPPGALTLDVACGEGRVARELLKRGHRVVGVEGSPALAQAARDGEPPVEVHVADAAALPLDDASADLAVVSLALMNFDDPAAVVREIARVLRPGGRLVASLLHPLNSWGDAGDVGYFATTRYGETLIGRDGARMTLHDTHRPLVAYTAALADVGFAIERLVEPQPDDEHVAAHSDAARWRDRPSFLHLCAVLDAR